MSRYITNIHVNKLFHLNNINIPIADEKYPHLIITGKNGSGKTILLNAIATLLELMLSKNGVDRKRIVLYPNGSHAYELSIDRKTSNLECIIYQPEDILERYHNRDFIIAFYQADRSLKMIEPTSPQKADIRITNIRRVASNQFIKFLVDLKFQELLAISHQDNEKVNSIRKWFSDFEILLKTLFQDNNLSLLFNQENGYSFKINLGKQSFGFNEMSDGFKSAINIVADLILRMQDGKNISNVYLKEGIVLIDEIETHLHLALQKIIMPFLTKTFPNIQFIVTTHSPFVLSSMSNAVAYDLEHQKILSDLTEYSYEVLAEGYFGISTESSSVEIRLKKLIELLSKKELSNSDKNTIRQLITELDKISEAVSPDLVGEYRRVKLDHVNIIKEVLS